MAAYNDNPGIGLEVLFVLGEDANGAPPTLNYCKQYADQYSIPYDKVVIDNGAQYGGWETTFSHIYPYLADDGSFALPWDAILDGDNMEYMFASSYTNGFADVSEALNYTLSN